MEKKLTILLAHNYYKIRGGEDVCFEEEAALLRAQGHRVVEYARHNDEIDTLGQVAATKSLFWSKRTAEEVRQLLVTEEVDLVHVHNFFPLISPSIYTEAKRLGIPVVQTLHNYRLTCANGLLQRHDGVCEQCIGSAFGVAAVVHKCYRESRLASLMVTSMTAWHRFAGTWKSNVDCFIVPSAFVREKMVASGLPKEKVLVRANVVSKMPVVEHASTREGAVYVGRLSDEKGVLWLAKVWAAHFKDVPLTLIGDGPQRTELDKVAEGTRIRLLGAQERSECLAAMAQAKVLVMPSQCYETFGRTVVEAFSVGTPVVVPRVGALAELVSEPFMGSKFDIQSVEQLIKAVHQHLSCDDSESLEMKLTQHFHDHFSPQSIYRDTIKIYKNLIS